MGRQSWWRKLKLNKSDVLEGCEERLIAATFLLLSSSFSCWMSSLARRRSSALRRRYLVETRRVGGHSIFWPVRMLCLFCCSSTPAPASEKGNDLQACVTDVTPDPRSCSFYRAACEEFSLCRFLHLCGSSLLFCGLRREAAPLLARQERPQLQSDGTSGRRKE